MAQVVQNLQAMQVDLGSVPRLGRSPGEEKGYPLQYSGLENSIMHFSFLIVMIMGIFSEEINWILKCF